MLNEASKQRVKILCDQIAKEEDRDRFSKLISELNELLESADARGADGNSGGHYAAGKLDGSSRDHSQAKADGISEGKTDGSSNEKADGTNDVTPPGNRPS